jgi:hypothetical protein
LSLDVSTLQSGKLMVGLLDPQSFGSGFTSLHFTITREGAIVEDQTFATIAAATTYFNDRALDFGALKAGVTGTLDLTFFLEMTTLDNGTRYGINFLVADVGLVPGGVDGDYNNDGVVDGADYVMFQKLNGTSAMMENDPNPLPIGNAQYNTWRTHFGETGPGSGSGTGKVPEPAVALLLATVLLPAIAFARSRHRL